MSKQSGRGKQSFRDFTRTSNQLKSMIERAFKSGEIYTEEMLYQWYQDILGDYANTLEEERLDYELWYTRAEIKTQEDRSYLRDKYPDNMDYGTGEDEGSEDDNIIDYDEEELPNSILSHTIVTQEECLEMDGHPRGQILLTLEEFAEYIDPIPGDAIRGVILQFDEAGNIKGFSLCVGDTQ